MHKNRFRGFTLIELLVVIAIIGILSAVVLASLSTARTKGSDAAIQSDLATIQTQAEIWASTHNNLYNTSGSAVSACSGATNIFGDTTIANATAGITTNGSTPLCFANAAGSFYIAGAASRAISGSYFCVDSNGNATTTKTAPSGTSTACGN